MTEQVTQPQGLRLVEKFALIKVNVTAADREAAATELKVNPVTVSRYINAKTEIKNADLGVQLLTFLRKRIIDREILMG